MKRAVLLAMLAAALLDCDARKQSGVEAALAPAHAASEVRYRPPAGVERLVLSSTPSLDPAALAASRQPLADHLSARLMVPVEFRVASTYDELGVQLGRSEVDVAEFSPFAYVRARQAGVELVPVVSAIAEGSATAAGYIVVRADSEFEELGDLRGRTFAFVDRASTTGFLFPTKVMLDRGLNPTSFFSRTDFLGNHEAALLAVHEGRFDACSTYQGSLGALQRHRGIPPLAFRIVAKTPRAPRNVFAARAGLPTALTDELRRVLLDLSVRTPEGRALLTPMDINGFVRVDDRQFDVVREAWAVAADAGYP